MTEKTPHILAISSFAVHGTASLKTFITILGERILPVPSLLLNGLTNMSMVQKFETPFRELLQSSFDLARNRNLDLILYIGYMGSAEQADLIIEMIRVYRHIIKIIITDPVCGDHGRTYVPAEVIAKWPAIVQLSDMAFPNITELKLLTGNQPDAGGDIYEFAGQFAKLYPHVKLVVTSVPGLESTGVYVHGDEHYRHRHSVLSHNYGGSGDAFLALFIKYHFYNNIPFNDSLRIAANEILHLISRSIAAKSDDLILTIIDKPIP